MLVANNVVDDSRVIKSANSIHELGMEITIFGIGDEDAAQIVRTKTTAEVVLIDDPGVLLNRSKNAPFGGSTLPTWKLWVLRLVGAVDPWDPKAGWRYRNVSEFRWRRLARTVGRSAGPLGDSTGVGLVLWKGWSRMRARWHSAADRAAAWVFRQSETGGMGAKEVRQLQNLKARQKDLEIAFAGPVSEFRPDLIWVHDYHPLPAANAIAHILETEGRPVKVVYDAHELVGGIASSNPGIPSYLERLEKRNIGGADCILTVSPGLATRLRTLYPDLPVPSVVPNCPSTRRRRPSPDSIRDFCSLLSEEPIAAYSGSLAPQRGATDAIQAMAYMPDCHLVLVSNPGDKHREPLLQLAHQMGLSSRVHFVPYAPQDELVDYLSSATVGLSCLMPGPLNHEVALPNKLFEFIHAELPVVVSDRQEQSEFVSQRGIGYVYTSGNAVDLAEKIAMAAKLPSDPEFSKRLASTRQEYAWENFNSVFQHCASI